MKFANAIQVFKKEDNLDYNNDRPISIISNIGKLIEKVVLKSLYSFRKTILFFSSSSMDLEITCQLIMFWLISPIEFKKPVTMISMRVEFTLTLKTRLMQWIIIIYYWTT